MERIVMTMPIKPQKNTNIGMFIAPAIMNTLSEMFECKGIMATNLLNTYKNKDDDLQIYIDDLEKQGIKYTELFVDKYNSDKILEVITRLVYDGYVTKERETIYRCQCGKVDILNHGISNVGLGKLYFENEGNYYCSECKSLCIPSIEEVLVLNLPNNIDDSLLIVPTFLKNDANHLSKTFKGSKLLVSKLRETGYQLNIDGKVFNIDIDFIWMNYFQLFSEKQKIMLASNHQTLQMYLLNYLNRISRNDEICFVANPYMNNCTEFDPSQELNKTSDEFYKKLFILYNLKWRKKNCDWSKSVIDYLSTISNTRRQNLYKTILLSKNQFDQNMPIDEYIENILITGTNMQKNIVDAKKLVKKP